MLIKFPIKSFFYIKKFNKVFCIPCIVTLFFVLSSITVFAQSPVKFGIGIEGGVPTGSASDGYSANAGVSLNVRVPLPVTNLDIIGSVGYQQWFVKGDVKDALESVGNELGYNWDVKNPGLLPIRVGAQYGFGPSPFYVKFDLGPAFTVKEMTDNADSGTLMSYSPGLGVKFGPLNAEVKYDIYSKNGTTSFFGVKLAYFFN